MSDPHTKEELLADAEIEFVALENYLAALTPEQIDRPGVLGEWSAKDVVAHLYEWIKMLSGWLALSRQGAVPQVPGEGYTWNQLDEFNEMIRQKDEHLPWAEALSLFRSAHHLAVVEMESFSEEDLLRPHSYPWIGQGGLLGFFDACTGEHYRWARLGLQEGFSRLGKAPGTG